MPNRFPAAAARLAGRLKNHAGNAVTIVQGNKRTPLVGTPKRQTYELVDSAGALVSVESIDWLFTAADLVDADGQPIELIEGTLLIESAGNTARHYKAMLIGNRPAAEDADANATIKLLHTRRVPSC